MLRELKEPDPRVPGVLGGVIPPKEVAKGVSHVTTVGSQGTLPGNAHSPRELAKPARGLIMEVRERGLTSFLQRNPLHVKLLVLEMVLAWML